MVRPKAGDDEIFSTTRPARDALRAAQGGPAADRAISILARLIGHAEAGIRRGTAANIRPVVARPPERRTVIHLLGRHHHPTAHCPLRACPVHRGRYPGVCLPESAGEF